MRDRPNCSSSMSAQDGKVRVIGRSIATELVAHARRAGFIEVELHVTATQTAAIALYCSLGFREMSRQLFTTLVFGAVASFDTIYMTLIL
jgi:predicted GNAT superfamily acetyltransferase